MKQEILKGFISGILATITGVCTSTFVLAQLKSATFDTTFYGFLDSGNFWMLLALGALVNLLVFFVFLQKNQEYKARGVLMATLLVAFIAFVLNLT